MAKLKAEEVFAVACAALERNGVPPRHANIVADATLAAELRGVTSHGLQMIPTYIARIRGGGLVTGVEPEPAQIADTMYRIDAKDGFGHIAAQRAVDLILRETGQNHTAVVLIHNTSHCGMLAYYTRQIARGYAYAQMTVNTNPNVPAFGGAEKVLGTNPFSVAFPYEEDCVLIDMATTSMAKGKIYECQKEGKALPPGCSLDREGRETTDPAEAIAGMLLPFAGHKGYAISLAVEWMSGVMSGGGFSKQTYSLHAAADKKQNLGAFLQGIPLAPLMPPEIYNERMTEFSRMIKGSKLADGSAGIWFPGDLERDKEERNRQEGVVIGDALLMEIESL